MISEDSLVNPVVTRHTPRLTGNVVMAAVKADLMSLSRPLMETHCFKRMYSSRLYIPEPIPEPDTTPVSLAGPMVGAPYAVMILESLIAWGARKIIFFGWCGAVSPDVRIGDIIVPTSAMIEEGTSGLYAPQSHPIAWPSVLLVDKIEVALRDCGYPFKKGPIWTTDAVYRETRKKIESYQKQGVLSVEMELSALFTVGRYRHVEMGGLLVVSDEINGLKWKPGFKTDAFKQGRENAIKGIIELCQTL